MQGAGTERKRKTGKDARARHGRDLVMEAAAFVEGSQGAAATALLDRMQRHQHAHLISAVALRALAEGRTAENRKSMLRWAERTSKKMNVGTRMELAEGLGATAIERGAEDLWNLSMELRPRRPHQSKTFSLLASHGIDVAKTLFRAEEEALHEEAWRAANYTDGAERNEFGIKNLQKWEDLPNETKKRGNFLVLPWGEQAWGDLMAAGAAPELPAVQDLIKNRQLDRVLTLVDKTHLQAYSPLERMEIALGMADAVATDHCDQKAGHASDVWARLFWAKLHPHLPPQLAWADLGEYQKNKWESGRTGTPAGSPLMPAMVSGAARVLYAAPTEEPGQVSVDICANLAMILRGGWRNEIDADAFAGKLRSSMMQGRLEQSIKAAALPPVTETPPPPRRRM